MQTQNCPGSLKPTFLRLEHQDELRSVQNETGIKRLATKLAGIALAEKLAGGDIIFAVFMAADFVQYATARDKDLVNEQGQAVLKVIQSERDRVPKETLEKLFNEQ